MDGYMNELMNKNVKLCITTMIKNKKKGIEKTNKNEKKNMIKTQSQKQSRLRLKAAFAAVAWTRRDHSTWNARLRVERGC